jgi:hypothetical protein
MMNLPQSASRAAGRGVAQSKKHLSYAGGAAFARLLLIAVLVMTVVPSLWGQALPAAEAAPISTGFSLPRTAGTLNWGVSASEALTWGYYGNQGAAAATNLTGNLGFI